MEEQIRISFFRHYTNAQKDEKIIQLLRKEEWRGYGLYWALLEFLTPIKDHKAKTEYGAIAWDLHIPQEADLIKRIVENYGLFIVKNGYFWSKSLTSQLEETAENIKRKKAAASRAGKSSAEKRKAANTNSNDSSTDVAENPTSVATDDGSPLINDIHEIHEIDTPCGISLSNDKENTQGVGDNTPTQQFVLKKKKNFIMGAMTCEGDYPKQLRKSFADYWTQPLQADPSRMLFEEKKAFDIPTQLRRWSETERPDKRVTSDEEVISYDQYYKRYGTTLCQDGWETRHNPTIGKMEYYRKINN